MKVAWSPVDPDKFLTYSNNVITLYRAKERDETIVPKGSLSLSDSLYAVSLARLTDVSLMKNVAWYRGDTTDSLIAVSTANGKLLLLSNGVTKGENDLNFGKEYIPKHLRQCNYLVWNPVHHNLLAQGLDKHRSDSCIYIWDVNMRSTTDLPYTIDRQRYNSNISDNVVNKPYLELCMNETTSSFDWFKNEPKTFVTGMSGRNLRVYDLRDVSKPHLVAQTKYVHGVCTDPLHESRVASYSDTHVAIWDVRSFDKPFLTLPCDRAVMQIDWCPTRPGFLAVLWRESLVVKLYDIRHSVTGTDELEPVIFERNIQPNRQISVTNFAWHPTCENRLMTVTPNGGLHDYTIFEKLPMSLSPNTDLSWVFSRKIKISDFGSEMDMGARIKQRALQGYGLHYEDLWNNAVVVTDEPHLHALWHWLDLSNALLRTEEVGARKGSKTSRFIGVLDLLGTDRLERPSSSNYVAWQYPNDSRGNTRDKSMIHQYKSEARERALQLCGWWYYERDRTETGDPLTLMLDRLVNQNCEYERAAAIALFNTRIGKAVEILSCDVAQEENPVLCTVAMALAGFTEEKNAMWRKTCCDLRLNLRNPYLRAMFAFLVNLEKDGFEEVLKDDPCMAVKDRVAFACMYLNDIKLSSYLQDLSKVMKQNGDLDGVLLTGLTNEDGVELLGKYVDLTGDVQTASLAVVYSSPNDLHKDDTVNDWIESYRELLDRWQLWHQRAKFDIIRRSLDNVRVPGQAFVSCNFCGKSIACNMTLASRSRPSAYTGNIPPNNKPKITCCPGCRKSLPRCALCLTNLGTPSGSALYQQKEKTEFLGKLSPFDNWFTWCQTCRHGGHSSHITDWFHEHSECPVTGCLCKCMTLDPASQLAADMSHLHLLEDT